ncbi:MAG: hypothetical protein ACOC1X_00355 [Promethearchaeota archaeon]
MKDFRERKCTVLTEKSKRCNKVVYGVLKVRVFHPNSHRRTWQTWYMCQEHFNSFIEDKGQDWGCRYRDKNKPFCPVIDYKII